MRRRVEDHVPAAEADRQLKLGKGGLRDVEFTVQLLQLVHGRADESIRSPHTLVRARRRSRAGGYVGRRPCGRLAVCYRMLRVLEHRIQLYRLRRTHLMPTRGPGPAPAGTVGRHGPRRRRSSIERWRAVRREVRHLHEELFYRPLLPATASLSTDRRGLVARGRPGAARGDRLPRPGGRDAPHRRR